jgi:hypothetical protein
VQYSPELSRPAKPSAPHRSPQAAASIEQHKSRMREAETAGLIRTLARMVRRATTKPNA